MSNINQPAANTQTPQEKKKERLDKATLAVLIFTFIAVVIYTYITYGQYNTGVDTERRQLRSYLSMSTEIRYIAKKSNPHIYANIVSIGQTPAFNVKVKTQFAFWPHLSPSEESTNDDTRKNPRRMTAVDAIYPNEPVAIEITDPANGWAPLPGFQESITTRSGEYNPYVWGQVMYDDAFGCHRFLRFCKILNESALKSEDCGGAGRAPRVDDQNVCQRGD